MGTMDCEQPSDKPYENENQPSKDIFKLQDLCIDEHRRRILMKEYYATIYPCDLITRWLSYGNDYSSSSPRRLIYRELAFILENETHLRYLSFQDASEFHKKLKDPKTNTYKIDVGAIYNRAPCDHKKVGDFFPFERELVFDVDLTDYDVIRRCCKGTSVCDKCWRWIVIAVRVLDSLLRGHFGFQYLLWVFSGRRGIHCWVLDQDARRLSKRGREAISKYLTFHRTSSVINRKRVHPMAEDAYRTIMNSGHFDKLVVEQGWLDNSDRWKDILSICHDEKTRNILNGEFKSLKTAQLRWMNLKVRFDKIERAKYLSKNPNAINVPDLPTHFAARNFLRLFVLKYAYPRLDEKVSTEPGHLLKSPFSVHPKTGCIAVPLSAKSIDLFKLEKVPNIQKLSVELSRIKQNSTVVGNSTGNANERSDGSSAQTVPLIKQTSLWPFVEHFEFFIRDVITEENLSAE